MRFARSPLVIRLGDSRIRLGDPGYGKGSFINHVIKFLGIFDPPPPFVVSFTINEAYVIEWSFFQPLPAPPQLSTWFMYDPEGIEFGLPL